MKKIMMLTCCATLAAAHGGPLEDTLALARLHVEGTTNFCFVAGSWAALETNAAFAAQLDATLAARPPRWMVPAQALTNLPQTCAANMEAVRQTHPNVWRRYSEGLPPTNALQRAALYMELMDLRGYPHFSMLDFVHSAVVAHAAQIVRRRLRAQGMAITVGPDGANPVQKALEPLEAAFDAPRFAGLGAALEALGIDIMAPSLPKVPEGAELEARMERIFMGDEPFTDAAKGTVLYALGFRAYNAFVERYNGGAR